MYNLTLVPVLVNFYLTATETQNFPLPTSNFCQHIVLTVCSVTFIQSKFKIRPIFHSFQLSTLTLTTVDMNEFQPIIAVLHQCVSVLIEMFVLLKNKLFHRKSKIFHQACDYAKYSKTLIFLYCRAKDKKRYELVRTCIKSALKNRKSLSPSEFKTIETELCSKSYEFKYRGYCRYVFKVLSELQPPNDSLENAKHFVEAYNLKNNQRFKLQMINFYAKKASETNLTDEEEQELLRRFVILNILLFP